MDRNGKHEGPVGPHICGQLIAHKGAKGFRGKRNLSTSGAAQWAMPSEDRTSVLVLHCAEVNLKWVVDINF